MNYEEISEFAMEIIANSGMARSSFMEAIKEAKTFNFKAAEQKMKEGEIFYHNAHEIQNKLIFKEASGEEKIMVNILLVHSQDHLTMALMAKDYALEFIDVYKKIENK